MTDRKYNNKETFLLLDNVEGLGIRRKLKLLNLVDEPYLLISERERYKSDIIKIAGSDVFNSFEKLIADGAIDGITERLYEAECGVVCRTDDEWNDGLSEIFDSPVMLYYRGDLSLLKSRCISVVGTRAPSRYGVNVTRDFVSEFAQAGLTVVSGFARGIDSAAHKTAVELELPTIAVLANGIDICYPAENRSLRDGILDTGGLLVSEYKPKTSPANYNFPERNRIIAGLSEGLFVPEMKEKSGTMLTVNHAIEQGKTVYVVPSNINSPTGKGTNALIKSMQGCVVTEPSDVLVDYKLEAPEKKAETYQFSIVEQQIMDELALGERHFEELIEATSLSVNELNSVLLELEINDRIEKTNGNFYMLR